MVCPPGPERRARDEDVCHPAVMQPVFEPRDGDLERKIPEEFPDPAEARRAAEILAAYEPVGHRERPDRIRLAALYLAGGSLERLAAMVDLARVDYRDVLAGAEYRAYVALPLDASAADKQAAIEVDGTRYGTWVGRSPGRPGSR